MERKSLHSYYNLGTCIRYLQDAQEGFPIHQEDTVLTNIDAVVSRLDKFGLSVTTRTNAFRKLKKLRDKLSETKGDESQILSKVHATELRNIMHEMRPTLEAEISGFSVFFVLTKRLDVNKLLEDVPSLFSPGIYSAMPDIAQYDFLESARCIAFERPTAASFHMLRGTEAVLRDFYCALIKQKRIKSLMWGPIVADLRQRRKTKEHETLLNNLDNIRKSFRNPTQHPEAIYDIHEAQDLWGLCIDVINRMIKIRDAT